MRALRGSNNYAWEPIITLEFNFADFMESKQ
jgi:hypothetical protein